MTGSLHTPGYRRVVAALVAARKARGMSQQDVADRLRKPQSYVAKLERAERRLDIVEFIALSRALGVDPAELFADVARAADSKR
ncbi:MAG: helix-turn-helix transcriptional regulator [Beijerinckiaceae bacterium]